MHESVTPRFPEAEPVNDLSPRKAKQEVITLVLELEQKVIRNNTLEGVAELFTRLLQLRQEVEVAKVGQPNSQEWADVLLMIDLVRVGIEIGDKRQGMLQVEWDVTQPTKRALTE